MYITKPFKYKLQDFPLFHIVPTMFYDQIYVQKNNISVESRELNSNKFTYKLF